MKKLIMAGVALVGTVGASLATTNLTVAWSDVGTEATSQMGSAVPTGLIIFGTLLGLGVAVAAIKKLKRG